MFDCDCFLQIIFQTGFVQLLKNLSFRIHFFTMFVFLLVAENHCLVLRVLRMISRLDAMDQGIVFIQIRTVAIDLCNVVKMARLSVCHVHPVTRHLYGTRKKKRAIGRKIALAIQKVLHRLLRLSQISLNDRILYFCLKCRVFAVEQLNYWTSFFTNSKIVSL